MCPQAQPVGVNIESKAAFTLRAVLRGTALQQLRSTSQYGTVLRSIYGAALRSTALRCAHLFIFTLCKLSDVNTEMADDDDVLAIAYWCLVCNNE